MTQDPPPAASPKPGLPLLIVGLSTAAMSGAVMKGLAEELPAALIVWVRFTGFVLLMVPVVLWRKGRARMLSPVMPLMQVVRGAMMAVGVMCFIVATRTLDFAEAITLLYIYPFIITLLAPFFLKEPPRLLTFLGVAGGFVGVLLVARPSGDGLMAAGTPFALACGVLIAGQMLLNRRLGGTVDPLLTSFWGACVVAAMLTPFAPWIWQAIDAGQAARLALIAAMAAVSQTFVTIAFARSPAAELAPFTYVEIVAGVAIGFAVFGTLPDALSFVGMGIIVASGVMVARIQRGRITARRQPKI